MRVRFFISVVLWSVLVFCGRSIAQNADAGQLLQAVEQGHSDSIKSVLPQLIKDYPDNAELLFVDAVLTNDGDAAVKKFEDYYTKHPEAKYADAAVARSAAYYYAIGAYKKSDEKREYLKRKYPDSPYNNTASSGFTSDSVSVSGEKIKKETAVPESGTYAVQAGAFISSANANKLRDQIKKAGYNVSVQEREVGGTVLYVVLVERLTKQQAADAAAKIDAKFKIKSRILENNK